MFESDKFWADLVRHLGVPELADDDRFNSHAKRAANSDACVHALDDAFGRYTLAELKDRFETLRGAWGPVQSAVELHDDPAAIANGYLSVVKPEDGPEFTLVAPPVQFDEEIVTDLRPAPDHGQHTDAVLEELGYDWDRIVELKVAGAVL